jgi:hypothetical protein
MSRTWKSILRALKHPTYTAPSLKSTLISRISKLQNCADAYAIIQGQASPLGDSITVDGVKSDVTPQQKDLVDKLSKEVQLESAEAFKIVLHASHLGVVDLDDLVKSYMDERTALLEVVKWLFKMESHRSSNRKTLLLAKEIVAKIKEDKAFLSKVIQGIQKRVGQQLPAKAATDSSTALLWSRQVLHLRIFNLFVRCYWRNINW